MQISDVLAPERISCDVDSHSKKSALEVVAKLIAEAEPGLSQAEVFNSLITREKLGSTGLGHGVALPHGRRKQGEHTIAAFVRLESPVDYDAIDGKPVDLMVGLLVPEHCTDEHLKLLASLAERFSDKDLLRKLRSEASPQRIFKLLAD